MRNLAIISCLLIFNLSSAVSRGNGPATQPSSISPSGNVYLFPFIAIGADHRLDWVGTAVQQNLLADLARAKLQPIAADRLVETTDALASAKSTGAKYLVTGTYQTADQLLRLNGQIINASTGNAIGGLSATGAQRDLFSMEDALSAQAIQQLARLPGLAGNSSVAAGAKPSAVPPALWPAVVVQLLQPPAAAVGSSYDGSALQQYIDGNRTPSTDFNQQLDDARDRTTYAPFTDYGTYGGYYDGYGLSLFYNFNAPFGGYGFGGGRFNSRVSRFGASGYFHHGGGHGHR